MKRCPETGFNRVFWEAALQTILAAAFVFDLEVNGNIDIIKHGKDT